MATNDDWVPIPELSELKTRAKMYRQEHEHTCKQYNGATVMYTKNIRTGCEAQRREFVKLEFVLDIGIIVQVVTDSLCKTDLLKIRGQPV